jgi:peptidoglycan hydrolase-like protein with peptidoglycan-binding domain
MHVEPLSFVPSSALARSTRSAYRPGPSLDEVASGAATFERGHSGEDVRALQRLLNARGIGPQLAEDGLFGPKTERAVRRFQRSHDLDATGVIDRSLLAQLAEQGASARDDFGRASNGPSRRAPRQDAPAPEGSIPAGQLQQRDEAERNARRQQSPAPSTTSRRASAPVNPPLTSSAEEGRSRETYDRVIDQFGVGTNPRYERRNGNTYCNIFAWDVTRAMGAEVPHWVRRDGSPAQAFERGAHEMNGNETARWLERHGSRYGWRRATAEEAQDAANGGRPAVVARHNPGGVGHIAVVRPGEITDRGPAIAQAGARNFNNGHVRDVWRRNEPSYWVHD